jgi:hypothetical protein
MQVKQTSVAPEIFDPKAIEEQLRRLLKSDLFRRSPVLTHLFEFLVSEAICDGGDAVTESVIAVKVFNRAEGFDSRVDNIVRVHAHRLRKTLDAWYAGEGGADQIRFVIPKGSYSLQIQRPHTLVPGEVSAGEGDSLTSVSEPEPNSGWKEIASQPLRYGIGALSPKSGSVVRATARTTVFTGVALLAVFALGSIMTWSGLRIAGRLKATSGRVSSPANDLTKLPLSALWQDVFRSGTKTLVSFTNPVFLRTAAPAPRIYATYKGPYSAAGGTELNARPDDVFIDKRLTPFGPLFFTESWTGTGEIVAVHKLTQMATEAGLPLTLVRARALTLADMHAANVIFLGSPWANDMQARFNLAMAPFQCFGTDKIVNRAPKGAEPAQWVPEINPTTKEVIATYAVFGVLPGLRPELKIVSSSGIDTFGTLAAIELMTSVDGVRDVMRRLGTLEMQTLPSFFQVVVRTEIVGGDPANTTIVAVRSLRGQN